MLFENKETIQKHLIKGLQATYDCELATATNEQIYQVLASLVRQEMGGRLGTQRDGQPARGEKKVYYFSMEFLTGLMFSMNLRNLGLYQITKESLGELGLDLGDIAKEEIEPGLGNGGLGRLAVCYLDAMASYGLDACGCGLGYKHGLFKQKFVDGYQIELPEAWAKNGCVWETRRIDETVEVRFYGQVDVDYQDGNLAFYHHDYQRVQAIPYYMYYVGAESGRINPLKIWTAELSEKDIDYAHLGQHNLRSEIVRRQRNVEEITEFLYPDDSDIDGRRLRLKQQYFLSSAGVQTIVRDFKKTGLAWSLFSRKVAIHINDTHPVLVIPELMRILLDEEDLGWEEAWTMTCESISYTNHTTLPEALETWPLDMMRKILPRVTMIIEEINGRANQACRESGRLDGPGLNRVAVIVNDTVYMANLAVACSYSVNGVAKLHTQILKEKVMHDFFLVYPEKFHNITNGINHRRWLVEANPGLHQLISETIGEGYVRQTERLKDLRPYATDPAFAQRFQQIKRDNKDFMAAYIRREMQIAIDPDSIFDVQIKRLHGYKRQLMNILHIVHLYFKLLENPTMSIHPHTFIFGAKAAPGYLFSKDVIKLINTVAHVINRDERLRGQIKVVFIENYSVPLAEMIIPASDISQQISTASKEASGTGNMKLMLNGALTLGTLDGANVEICEAVGRENMFIFGMTSEEVLNHSMQGTYDVMRAIESKPHFKKLLKDLESGVFSQAQDIIHNLKNMLLLENDQYFVVEDFEPYLKAQELAEETYKNPKLWTEKAIINVAQAGYFTGDRAISQYINKIWMKKS